MNSERTKLTYPLQRLYSILNTIEALRNEIDKLDDKCEALLDELNPPSLEEEEDIPWDTPKERFLKMCHRAKYQEDTPLPW
jgi:hypothetical protein